MAGACPSFHSMKQLRVVLLPPGWDTSPSQGYPQQYVTGTHLYTWVERDNVGLSFLSQETTRWQELGLEPPTFRSEVQRANHYTTAPHILFDFIYCRLTWIIFLKLLLFLIIVLHYCYYFTT